MTGLASVAATPYPWPFDGVWSTGDTALLLLGLQRGPVAETGAGDVVARLAGLLALWRAAGGAVVHCRRGYDPSVGLPAPAAWRNARRQTARILARGDPGWPIHDTVLPLAGEPVVDHAGDNAFLGTDLAFVLQRAGIRNLIVGGIRTEEAVHATMRAANDAGHECLLLEDGTATDDTAAQATIVSVTRFGNGLFGATATIAATSAALPGQGREATQ